MATKIKSAPKTETTKETTKQTKETESAENVELIAAEVPRALKLIQSWKTSEEVTQGKFIDLVKHFRDWQEENEASTADLKAVLRQAYAEHWNSKNKTKIKAAELAGKDGLTNYGSLVAEIGKIQRWVFPKKEAIKVFAKAFNERVEGEQNYTIASLDNCAKTGEKPTVGAKRGRKPASDKPTPPKSKADKFDIKDLEKLKTEIAVVMARVDVEECDPEEIGEAVNEQVTEWVSKKSEEAEE